MPLPFFYTEPVAAAQNIVVLNEENSKHAVQVLRMQNGEQLKLTDGLGNLYTAEISDAHKKKCTVNILERSFEDAPATKVSIAVSPVKNNSRFEWFLEKATEMGVTEIIPLLCSRTEKQHFRYDRMNGILISALLQSQQVWLPKLHEPVKYEKYLQSLENKAGQKFIAHCEEDQKTSLRDLLSTNQPINQSTILIGPEGDFTKEEIALALRNNFVPVALGDTRLRTETAALVAATLLCVR
jgi:16S rRNA (uracil1498-N3)-methyltransferase